MKYRYFTDRMGGFVEVNRAELIELNIVEHITVLSHTNPRGNKVYLDDYIDMAVWEEAHRDKYNYYPELEETQSNSPCFIRKYPAFRAREVR